MAVNGLLFLVIFCIGAFRSKIAVNKILLFGMGPLFLFFIFHFAIPDATIAAKAPGRWPPWPGTGRIPHRRRWRKSRARSTDATHQVNSSPGLARWRTTGRQRAAIGSTRGRSPKPETGWRGAARKIRPASASIPITRGTGRPTAASFITAHRWTPTANRGMPAALRCAGPVRHGPAQRRASARRSRR